MRVVPLIAAVSFVFSLGVAAKEIHVYAGRSSAALKLQNDGLTYEEKSDYATARKKFDEAIRLDPTMWPAYFNRATLNMKEHKFGQALEDATTALRGKSTFNESAVLRAMINIKLGDYAAACRDLDTLISLGAKGDAYAQALNGSAWLRATCPDSRFRNGQLALRHATLACRITSDRNPDFLDTLAAANAEEGNFDAAIRIEQKALTLRGTPEESKELHEHMREHMASFKQHRPWRDVSK